MRSVRIRTLVIGLTIVVAVLAGVTLAFAGTIAPTIPAGVGWNAHHSSYPGYCLDCHTRFAVSPPAITQGAKAPHGDRGSTCTQCHVVRPAVTPPPAGPKPVILSGAFSNPIAYDIRSLQKTTFRFSSDVAGAKVVLSIRTSAGSKTIWQGTVTKANTVLATSAWNGLIAGKRLPTGSYDWDLAVSTSAGTAKKTGKITMSKIYFGFSGTSTNGVARTHTGYMKAGGYNVYLSATTPLASDTFKLQAFRGTAYRAAVGNWAVKAGTPCRATVYMRGGSGVPTPGLTSFNATGRGISYRVTIIQ